MEMLPHPINYLAVLVSGVAIFILGGLWYSKAMFVKPWMMALGIPDKPPTEEQKKMMPMMLAQAFIGAVVSSYIMAVLLNHFINLTALRGACVGAGVWFGFGGVTSYVNGNFAQRSKMVWAIDAGYNVVSFAIAGVILALWR